MDTKDPRRLKGVVLLVGTVFLVDCAGHILPCGAAVA